MFYSKYVLMLQLIVCVIVLILVNMCYIILTLVIGSSHQSINSSHLINLFRLSTGVVRMLGGVQMIYGN